MGAVGEVGRMHGGSCLVKQASQSRERPRARGQARRRCQVSAGVRVPVHPSFLPSLASSAALPTPWALVLATPVHSWSPVLRNRIFWCANLSTRSNLRFQQRS